MSAAVRRADLAQSKVVELSQLMCGTPSASSRCRRISEGLVFQALCALATAISCFAIALDTELRTTAALTKAFGGTPADMDLAHDALLYIRAGFIVWMIIEILVNFAGQRSEFFTGRGCSWNWFDMFVLVMACLELGLSGPSIAFVRFFRMARSSRLLQAFRMARHSTSLQKMLYSLKSVFASLFWASLLASMLVYITGLAMMESVSAFVLDAASAPQQDFTDVQYSTSTSFAVPVSLGLLQDLNMYYGGVLRTFATLFRAVTGADWSSFAAPMAKINAGWGVVWVFYIFFTVLGILNILAGDIVDILKRPVPNERAMMSAKDLADEKKLLKFLTKEIDRLDLKTDLNKRSFETLISLHSVVRCLTEMGIDIHRVDDPFSLVNTGRNDKVPVEIAATKLIAIRGGANSRDMVRLLHSMTRMEQDISAISRQLQVLERACDGAAFDAEVRDVEKCRALRRLSEEAEAQPGSSGRCSGSQHGTMEASTCGSYTSASGASGGLVWAPGRYAHDADPSRVGPSGATSR
eukprot:CAMPEP_0176016628 /NCGR_PEP_ID=MMETSP0120_2-20121206/7949_1 /TAXON_ID=160619 /ORGANISM="Kryptoperidinium foliaceum, Strain CCMP 1326" /LENGTH=523 /DNA_ID=CAMNT_0017349631 /DNA_START=14 /DNA_END=1583 /DNA_ORIENTATION=+